ncbi:MAG: glycosyltransferase family 2 protein [Mucilaginibacter sp.]|nr:glycosyltransferase family 2 protein [Mucilaginibacter sp.]
MIISVVIPMYNAEATIIRTLESVLQQDYKGSVEIIVVNDGAKDNSLAVLTNYVDTKGLNNVTIIDKPNGGVSTARNAGIKAAKGDYIALLDSDDVWLPQKLRKQVEVLTTYPDIDFLGTNRNDEYFPNFYFKKFGHLTTISARLLLYKVFLLPQP